MSPDGVQTLGDQVQVNHGSISQVLLHPSPSVLFPSSHCSHGSSTQLPQLLLSVISISNPNKITPSRLVVSQSVNIQSHAEFSQLNALSGSAGRNVQVDGSHVGSDAAVSSNVTVTLGE